MPSESVRLLTEKWWHHAKADLAEADLNVKHGGAPYIGCFHAQQSVEKAIKTCYVWQQQAIPKTHDLDRLRNLLENNWPFTGLFPDLSEMTHWAVDTRYPGVGPDASAEEARQAVAFAHEFLESVESDLTDRGFF